MMRLISRELLEYTIEQLENSDIKTQQDKLMLDLCKKELLVLQKLDIDCNLSGSLEQVEKRIEGNVVYLINKEEFDEINRKSRLYDKMINFINGLDKE